MPRIASYRLVLAIGLGLGLGLRLLGLSWLGLGLNPSRRLSASLRVCEVVGARVRVNHLAELGLGLGRGPQVVRELEGLPRAQGG